MNAKPLILLALLPVMPVAANNQTHVDPRLFPGPTVMKATIAKAVGMADSRMMATSQPTGSTGWIGNVADKEPTGMILVILAVLAAILLLVGAVVFLSKRSRKTGPCYFPEPSWQPRLGAPHAGGNQAVRDLGSPLP